MRIAFPLLAVSSAALSPSASAQAQYTVVDAAAFVSDASGAAQFPLSVPGTGFLGLELATQAAILNTPGPLGLDASNGVLVVGS